MRIPRTIILAAIVCLPGASPSQIRPGGAPFRLDVDAARYAGSDSVTYVEIYYGVPEAGLTYVRGPGGGFRGAVEMKIRVSDTSGIVASREWTLPREVEDTAGLRGPRNILSFESLTLPAGAYRLALVGRDSVDPSRADSADFALAVGGFGGPSEAVSDIELCSRISPGADRASPFYRNTLEVIPNPSRLYGEGLQVLHFYAEVYNLDLSPGPDVRLRASILDAGGREVTAQTKTKPRSNRSSVEYGSMNIASLPGGSYVFRIALVDSSSSPPRTLASSEKKFFVYHPAGTPSEAPAAGAAESERIFSFMSEEDADGEVRKVRYIASEPERRQMEHLPDIAAKRNFLKNFWAGRNLAEGGEGGTARTRYLERVREADRQFTRQGSEGWLTDRGRVFVIYGPPDNVERHPSTSESHPYEVWEYSALQGGVVFVFVDRLGFGAYRLVHSTHLDELHNENWYQEEALIR